MDQQTTALALIETLKPEIFADPNGIEGIVSRIEAEVRATPGDATTEAGRAEIRSLAYKVARSKTALDEMGFNLVAGIKKQSQAIDADRKLARDRLDALRDEVRQPVIDFEAKEAARIANHEAVLVWIIGSVRFDTPPTAQQIKDRMAALANEVDRDFEEFEDRAMEAMLDANASLKEQLAAATQREADQAELAELRRLKAERDAEDRARALDEIEQENARLAAEYEVKQAAERKEAEEARARLAAEQSLRETKLAVERAIEAERLRAENAAKAEKLAQEKREANKRHRAKIHNAITAALLNCMDTALPSENYRDVLAGAIMEAIAAGDIPHVSIQY